MARVEAHAGLGDNVVPEGYRITIEPDLRTFAFKGSETISVEVKRPTKAIRLNSKKIKVKSASVFSSGKIQKASISYFRGREEISLSIEKPVSGRARIEIEFEGIHNDQMYGFYRSRYQNGEKEEYMVSTQFEAAVARAAFPCFDEPSFKATFDLTLIVDKNLDAISNMPVISKRSAGGKSIVKFARTPKMSTYLLFMSAGRFEYISMKSRGLLIRAVTPPGKKGMARLALQYAAKFVNFYEKYFGIRYPLPKLDLIDVPDFAAGAMENWGAVTFREIAMLGDAKSSAAVKRDIAVTVAHELAHQWFGDLVTMWWWNDLWLNESFATFMSYKAINSVFPKWKMDVEYITDSVTSALASDALKSTHPISVKVDSPQKIDEIFDAISYNKGGTVLTMLEDYVGHETFRKGLHKYLKAHSYSNATKYDLWGAIDAAARKAHGPAGASRIASQWLNEKGYPIISVMKENRGKGDFVLSQKKFTLKSDVTMPVPRLIPVHYFDSAGREGKILMSKGAIRIPNPKSAWIKLNSGQRSLYRVSYQDDMLARLGDDIDRGKIRGLDAWGIVNDLFALARSSRISASSFIEFMEQHCSKADYPLDVSIFAWLGWMHGMTRGSPMRGKVESLLLSHGNKALSKTGISPKDGEGIQMTELRSAAISALSMAGDKRIISTAGKLLEQQIRTGKPIASDIRPAVYRTVARHGSARDYERFVGMRAKEISPEEDHYLLGALVSFDDKAIMRKALAYALTKSVRLQDLFIVPNLAMLTDAGADLVWHWTKENWKTIVAKIPDSTHLLGRFVEALGPTYDKADMKEISAFFSSRGNMRGDIVRAYTQTMERIESNVRFREYNHLD